MCTAAARWSPHPADVLLIILRWLQSRYDSGAAKCAAAPGRIRSPQNEIYSCSIVSATCCKRHRLSCFSFWWQFLGDFKSSLEPDLVLCNIISILNHCRTSFFFSNRWRPTICCFMFFFHLAWQKRIGCHRFQQHKHLTSGTLCLLFRRVLFMHNDTV